MEVHIATTDESLNIDKILCKGSQQLKPYSISFHPQKGYNAEKKTYKNPDGSDYLAHIGIRIYKFEDGIGWSVYSEDLK